MMAAASLASILRTDRTLDLRALDLEELRATAWLAGATQRFALELPAERVGERREENWSFMPFLLWGEPNDPQRQLQPLAFARLQERREPLPGRSPQELSRRLEFDLRMPYQPGRAWLPVGAPASVLLAACRDEELAFVGVRNASVMPHLPAVAWTIAVLAVSWLALSALSWPCGEVRRTPGLSRWLRLRACFDPVLIASDSAGFGSLRRVQLLFFTFLISGLSLYILLRAGDLTAISAELLLLLGITAGGGGGSAAAYVVDRSGGPGLRRELLVFLARVGVIAPRDRFASWRDVFFEGAELGMHRVQAVVFSLLIAFFVVREGSVNLAALDIPDSYLLLAGFSRAIYVGVHAVAAPQDWGELERRAEAFKKALPDWQEVFSGPGVDGRSPRPAKPLDSEAKVALEELRATAARLLPRVLPPDEGAQTRSPMA